MFIIPGKHVMKKKTNTPKNNMKTEIQSPYLQKGQNLDWQFEQSIIIIINIIFKIMSLLLVELFLLN